MIEHVTIERESTDSLTRWTWRFYYDRHALWLDYYGEFQRPSRRHRFTCIASYGRINPRGSSLREADVFLPADLKDEVVKKFCEGITVKRWSERGGE